MPEINELYIVISSLIEITIMEDTIPIGSIVRIVADPGDYPANDETICFKTLPEHYFVMPWYALRSTWNTMFVPVKDLSILEKIIYNIPNGA